MEKYINGYLNHSWTILYISTAPLDTVASFVSWLVSLNFFLVCFPSIDAYSTGSREVQGHSCFALVYLSLIPPSCLLLWSKLALWSSFDSWYLQIFCSIEPLLLVLPPCLNTLWFSPPFPIPPCNPVAIRLTRCLLVWFWTKKKKEAHLFFWSFSAFQSRCRLVKSLKVQVSLVLLKIHFFAQSVQLLVWFARASLFVVSDCVYHWLHNLATPFLSQHCMWTTRPPSSPFSLLTLGFNLPTMWTTRPPGKLLPFQLLLSCSWLSRCNLILVLGIALVYWFDPT